MKRLRNEWSGPVVPPKTSSRLFLKLADAWVVVARDDGVVNVDGHDDHESVA
jgi:hypothetical protein